MAHINKYCIVRLVLPSVLYYYSVVLSVFVDSIVSIRSSLSERFRMLSILLVLVLLLFSGGLNRRSAGVEFLISACFLVGKISASFVPHLSD